MASDGQFLGYLAAVVDHQHSRQRTLFPGRTAREAALFAAVVALLVDGVFFVALAEAQLGGPVMTWWSAIKVLIVVGITGWLALDTNGGSLGAIALIFLLIGLEDTFAVTAPLGIWLLEESGLGRARQGSNRQLLRRGVVMVLLLGPTFYLARQAPSWLHKAVWTLMGFLAAIFVAAVLGDVAADRTGTNLDELLEEPILSLAAAFSIGLAVEWWPRRRLRTPTRR